MSLEACVDLVRRGDPDRAMAAELAPVDVQRILWPLYAMNVEVSRAPWITQEPMIAEMRLQWWRDALEEIADGKPVRAHDVTTALADAIGPEQARVLDRLVAARRWDIYSDAFKDEADLFAYLDDTAAGLMFAGAGMVAEPLRLYGRAVGVSRFLQAAPELDARGRKPLLDGTQAGIKSLCQKVLADMPRRLDPAFRHIAREGWQARALLKQAIKAPGRVADGTLALSEFSKRWRLLVS